MRPASRHHPQRPPVSPAAMRAQQAWQLGQTRWNQGKWDEALHHYEMARRHQPQDTLFGLNLANALLKAGQAARALEVATEAAIQDPDNPLAFGLRTMALMRLNRHEDLAVLLAAAPEAGMNAEAYCILGIALSRLIKPHEAIEAFLKSLALKPAEAETHYRLGLAFNDLTMKAEAAECFRTALVLGLGPAEAAVRDLLAFYERDVCDWRRGDESLSELRSAIERLPADAAVQTSPFVHVTLFDDPLLQLRAAVSCSRAHGSGIEPIQPRPVRHDARLRVGYVTADVRQHATAYLMAELLERHSRDRYEVTVYSHGREDSSPIHDRVVAGADRFVRTESMSPRETAEAIRADGIDILVDLKGYTQDARPLVFAYRPAPVQVAYLGFPGTCGADWMDYIIGDPIVTPLDHADFFTEKIAQVSGCYQCNDGTRPLPNPSRRADHGLREDALVLCGFNQAYKISPEVFDVWCRLLGRLPDAVLWLHSWNQQSPPALMREAQARGVDPQRLIFAPTMHQRAHLDRLPLADIFLDTWPCNGHTTASDMLWAGVPVVTLSGRSFASRVAASLLNAIGVPETACDGVSAYEAKVMELAGNVATRLDIRHRIEQARHTSPLFSGERIARDIEALYERMWARFRAGLPPAHLAAE